MEVHKYKHRRCSPSRKSRSDKRKEKEKVLGEYLLELKKSRKSIDLEAQVVEELEEKILSLKKNKELEEKSLSIDEKAESQFEGYKRFKEEEVEKLKKELKEVKMRKEDIGRASKSKIFKDSWSDF
ncbi:1153_t:CDS:2 [Gigaspora margarita]|uniref:1153_t:CDS:1 n=1 Tax=Gigaspora margarita TaxID=4874 RepID=A0ABM8VX22_GIGMA|nr:1153_t:CDS:2 [Gigaspora margarita]